ncbi:MAG: hypothetical protein U0Q22_06510 [Acidimicrobiales bacterium]
MTRRRRALRLGLMVGLFAVLAVLVMPGRLWFGQRDAIAQAEAQLTELRSEHRQLEERVTKLGSNALIEHEAREGFGWVHVRDELYTVTPAPPLQVKLPAVWPFDRLQEPLADAAAAG